MPLAKQLQDQYNASNLSSANADSTIVEDHDSRVSFAVMGRMEGVQPEGCIPDQKILERRVPDDQSERRRGIAIMEQVH